MNKVLKAGYITIASMVLTSCSLFQPIETTIVQPSSEPSAQELIRQALEHLYSLESSSLVENFDLSLYKTAQDYDRWTVNIRENWQNNPTQSLADIRLTLATASQENTAKSAQGVINISIAKNQNSERFIKLNDIHFAGADGHLIDMAIAQWTGQWFTMPSTQTNWQQLSWLSALVNTIEQVKNLPKETVLQGKYFTVLEAMDVQMSEEVANKLTVNFDQDGIAHVIMLLPENSIDPLLQKLISSSSFEGSLYIGEESRYLKKLEGTISLASPVNANQKIILKINIEISNINKNLPIALPTQSQPLPLELLEQASTENNVLE